MIDFTSQEMLKSGASLFPSSKGRGIHDKVIVVALEREKRRLSCLKADEREMLIELLRRLRNNLGAVTG